MTRIPIRHAPLRPGDWPGKLLSDGARKPSPFDATWRDTEVLLAQEAWLLGACEVVVQVAVGERGVRLDGGLRADAKAEHPGVIVSFGSKHGPLRYACDRFDSRGYRSSGPGWQQNVRAVALGLEALRKVERYGIAHDGQQYTGFAALPPAPTRLGSMSDREAIELLGLTDEHRCVPGGPFHEDDIDAAYRRLVKEHHPDVGGDPDMFRRITQARAVLL